MIFNKKETFFERKLAEPIGKPKDLWKALKSLGLTNNISSCEVSALKINNTVEHTVYSVLESFKSYCSWVPNKRVVLIRSGGGWNIR